MALSKVIIVGAGPAGLVLALLLAKAHVKVEVLEAESALDQSPRATHYSYPALHEFKRAGLLEEIRERGFVTDGEVAWRKLDGSLIAQINASAVPIGYRLHALPLDKLCKLVYEHIEKQPNCQVRFSHKVLSIDQSESSAEVLVKIPDGTEVTMKADYIIGCDGARSQIRRSLFGDNFPGRTWDEQIVATNVYYDIKGYGWGQGGFIVHPEHFSMVAQIQPDGLLRVTYGDTPGLTPDEYIARQPEKFRTILPGSPKPEDYKLLSISPYKIHQRCAESFRVGRFLLAADAAHLCNPFGGLGLTGGLVDVGNLYDCLVGVHLGLADDTILDRYSEVRRDKYFGFVDPVSSANLRRLTQTHEEAVANDEFFKMCAQIKNDPVKFKELVMGANFLMHDFTKEYTKVIETTDKKTTDSSISLEISSHK